jgi:hypothetical protein
MIYSREELQGISVDLCAGGNIETADTHFSEESSIVQVSDKVKHSVAHFYQVLRFSLVSQADLIQREDRMSQTSQAG